MELTPYLILMQWIIKHTFILSDAVTSQPITNNEIANIFFKEFPETKPILNKEINLLIGQFLKYVYGSELKKMETSPVKYNIGIVKDPIKDIFIRDYKSVYTFEYYYNLSKYNYTDVKEAYKSINNIFKGKEHKKRGKNKFNKNDLIKCDNLAKNIIIDCINKGVPKHLLRYFLLYCMSFLNSKDLSYFLMDIKKEFKFNKVCANCGAIENLTIHHIKGVSKAPYLEFNKDNFIVLCDSCHKQHHTSQDLKEIAENRRDYLNEVLNYADSL